MTWEENWVKDLEYIERNYRKEIDEYNDKYFRKDVFDRIIKKLKDNNFMIELDEFYEEDYKILGSAKIINEDYETKIYFKLFDFGSPDCLSDMKSYLKGELYSLDIALGFDILSYNEIKENYELINKVKETIDKVLKEIK